jgi:hypothetical protein
LKELDMSQDNLTPEPEPLPPMPQLPPSGNPTPYPPAMPPLPKSPALATVLALFPGLGQAYNGDHPKALVFFFAFVGSIYLTAQGNPFPFAFLIPFVPLYGMVDAHRGATRINARYLGGRPEPPEETQDQSTGWGIALVALGGVLLLNNFGWLNLRAIGRFWPLLLVAIGGYFIWNSIRQRQSGEAGRDL